MPKMRKTDLGFSKEEMLEEVRKLYDRIADIDDIGTGPVEVSCTRIRQMAKIIGQQALLFNFFKNYP